MGPMAWTSDYSQEERLAQMLGLVQADQVTQVDIGFPHSW